MAEEERSRAMSLIPYAPEHSREVVLRHESTVVLFDPRSRQLSLRSTSPTHDVGHCPTCQRPFRDRSPHRPDASNIPPSAGYMDPSYFSMLQDNLALPQRRLGSPELRRHNEPSVSTPPGAEFVASEPQVATGHGISKRAFSQDYFKTFFKEERELGRGGKGVVLLVTHLLDGFELGKFACKRVPVGDDHAWLEKVLIEVQTLQNLSHPNLVSYRHVWLENYQNSSFGPEIPCAFILQEYCDSGDLFNYVLGKRPIMTPQQLKENLRRRSKGQMEKPTGLAKHRTMHFEEIYTFFKDITSGLHHLHSHGFIHRDIKPSNCLLHNTGSRMRVLLSDFGEVQDATSIRNGTGATGTVSYCAPEVLRRDGAQGPFGNFSVKSDIFSVGMIVHFMCFGALPYSNADDINEDNEDVDQLRAEILAWSGYNDDERRGRTDLPEQLYKFLKRLLAIDPDDRPSTEEILRGIHAAQDPSNMADFAARSGIEDMRNPRISSADSPSPYPRAQFMRKTSSGGHPALAPSSLLGPPSKLSQSHAAYTSPPRSPQRHERERSISPIKVPNSTAIVRARKGSTVPRYSHSQPSSPLALPPPPQVYSVSRVMVPRLLPMFKLALFLLKYLSLAKPCQPLSPKSAIAYPFLTLAALDFILPHTLLHRWLLVPKWTVFLFLVHLLGVTLARRNKLLCEDFDGSFTHD